MSQEDLADKLGVSRQAISKWEGMLSVPDLQNVLKISDLFNVSTDYLLKDSIVEESACAAGVAESSYVNVFLHILFPAQPLIYGIGYGCTEYHPLYADTREDRDFLQQSTSCSTFCCLSTIYTGFTDTDTIFLSKKRRTASAVKT